MKKLSGNSLQISTEIITETAAVYIEDPDITPLSELQVLYCNNLAPDDFMWSVSGGTADLCNMLAHPVEWVNNLGQLPHWKNGLGQHMPPPVLIDHFTIELAVRKVEGDHRIIIQGISGTGIIRVSASHSTLHSNPLDVYFQGQPLPSPHLAPLDTYWDIFTKFLKQNQSYVELDFDNTDSIWFGHLQIYHPSWQLPGGLSRAEWITEFLLRSLLQPEHYAQCLNHLLLGVADEGINVIVPKQTITFSFAAQVGSDGECCDAFFGDVSPIKGIVTVLQLSNSIVKDYFDEGSQFQNP